MLRLGAVLLGRRRRIIFSASGGARIAMPQFWRGEGGNGFRVRYCAPGERPTEPREADLVFVDERPFAVLEWSEVGAATVSVELDPAKLRPADASGRLYDYSGRVIDRR